MTNHTKEYISKMFLSIVLFTPLSYHFLITPIDIGFILFITLAGFFCWVLVHLVLYCKNQGTVMVSKRIYEIGRWCVWVEVYSATSGCGWVAVSDSYNDRPGGWKHSYGTRTYDTWSWRPMPKLVAKLVRIAHQRHLTDLAAQATANDLEQQLQGLTQALEAVKP